MTSIIDYFNKNKYNYTASDSYNNAAYDAFDKKGKLYACTIPDGKTKYWQVVFDRYVTIGSYFITSKPSYSWYMESWDISYSNDGSSFIYLQTDAINDLRGNINKFNLVNSITCKGFRITIKSCNDGSKDIIFHSFDCFSPVKITKSRIRYSCNFAYYKRRLAANTLLTLYSIILY